MEENMGENMEKLKLSILDKYKNIDVNEALRNWPLPDSYWEKDAEISAELAKKNKERQDSIKMSDKKFRKPFDL